MIFFSRFLWHVWAAVATLVLISTLTFGLLTSNQLREYVESSTEHALFNYAALVNDLTAAGKSLDHKRLERFGRDKGIRITLINADGRVTFDNLEQADSMDNHGSRPEIMEASMSGSGSASRFSETLEKPMLYVAITATAYTAEEKTTLGFIRVSVSLDDVDKELASLRLGVALGGVLIAIVFLILGYLMVLRVSKPLLEMTDMSMKVAAGDYDRRVEISRKDELGQLGIALNQLAEGARDRISELQEGKSQLSSILSGLVEGVIAVNMQHNILHINQSAISLLNLHQKEPLEKRSLFEWVVSEELVSAVNESLEKQKDVTKEIIYRGKVLDTAVHPLKMGDHSLGAIIVLNNVTEVQRLEQIRTDFVANASHELKTPISAIKGYMETIIDDKSMTEETRLEFMSRITRQVERLDRVVQDLLQLSRLESADSSIQMSPVDISALLSELFVSRQQEAQEAGIDFQLEMGEEEFVIMAERVSIWQMITNLLDNAFSYTGSTLPGKVTLALSKKEDQLLIRVQDNGIGISASDQNRIFERFYRADKARSREKGGTGLGLSIVRNVVKNHGGRIEVSSQLGKGSTFTIILPIQPNN